MAAENITALLNVNGAVRLNVPQRIFVIELGMGKRKGQRDPLPAEVRAGIPDRIKAIRYATALLRPAIKITSTYMAAQLGKGPNAWSNWETGVNALTLTSAIEIRREFKVTLDYIFLNSMAGMNHDVALAIEASERRIVHERTKRDTHSDQEPVRKRA